MCFNSYLLRNNISKNICWILGIWLNILKFIIKDTYKNNLWKQYKIYLVIIKLSQNPTKNNRTIIIIHSTFFSNINNRELLSVFD